MDRHSSILSKFVLRPIGGTSRTASLLLRYGIAVSAMGIALGVALLLRKHDLPYPFTSFSFAAVAIAFWYAGTGPGLLALVLSYSMLTTIFVPANIGGASSESYLIIYGVFGLFLSRFSSSRRRAERLLTEARDSLELRVAERTAELTRSNNELRHTQSALHIEKNRLKALLDLTNGLVSTVQIHEALKMVVGTIREIAESDFVGVGLPGADNRIHAVDFVIDGNFPDDKFILEKEDLAVRVLPAGAVWTGGTHLPDHQALENSFLHGRFETVCALPLSGRGGARGVLVLGRRDARPYSQGDLDFLGQISNQIGIALENALAYSQIGELTERLSQEKLYLEDEIRSSSNFEEIIGTSGELRRVLKLVETVAPTDSTVLIHGETGTGKELIARAIHNLSARHGRTFVKLNCAAIPTGLLESELFGHEKGAFTGAVVQRIGRLELANDGTLFLDEIGDMPLELQPKLLRVLQEREFERLGSIRTISTNVRLIAATNRDLGAMVQQGTFRSDLFFRLNVFPILNPALRDRTEDVALLVRHFAKDFSRRMNKTIDTISSATMDALSRYPWPGNIRELQNVIERAVIVSPGPELRVPLADLQLQERLEPSSEKRPAQSARRPPVRSILSDVDRDQIIQALKDARGRVGGREGAASRLGMKRTTFITRMKKLGIVPNDVLGSHEVSQTAPDPAGSSLVQPSSSS